MKLSPILKPEERDGRKGWFVGLRLSVRWEEAVAWLRRAGSRAYKLFTFDLS